MLESVLNVIFQKAIFVGNSDKSFANLIILFCSYNIKIDNFSLFHSNYPIFPEFATTSTQLSSQQR